MKNNYTSVLTHLFHFICPLSAAYPGSSRGDSMFSKVVQTSLSPATFSSSSWGILRCSQAGSAMRSPTSWTCPVCLPLEVPYLWGHPTEEINFWSQTWEGSLLLSVWWPGIDPWSTVMHSLKELHEATILWATTCRDRSGTEAGWSLAS